MTSAPELLVRIARSGDDLEAAGDAVRRAYFALPEYPRDAAYDIVIGDLASRVDEVDVVLALLADRVVGCLTYVADHDNPHAEFDDPGSASFRYFGVDPDGDWDGIIGLAFVLHLRAASAGV